MICFLQTGDDIDLTPSMPPVLMQDPEPIFTKPSGCQRLSPLSKIIMPGHVFFPFICKIILFMQQGKNVFKLKGKIQQYAWGGTSYISRLLSVPNQENKPLAEYWLGAHDNAPSELDGASPSKLNEYIRQQPESMLGGTVAQRFGRLPYLLKILDVKDMLSIQ